MTLGFKGDWTGFSSPGNSSWPVLVIPLCWLTLHPSPLCSEPQEADYGNTTGSRALWLPARFDQWQELRGQEKRQGGEFIFSPQDRGFVSSWVSQP